MSGYDEKVYDNYKLEYAQNISPVLMKSINKIIQNEGYLTFSIRIKDISTEGGNFMSTLKEVDIKGKTINDNKETNLFIKQCLPDNGKNIASTEKLFLTEVFTYTELAKLFTEFENEFNLPDEEKFNFVKYYDDGNDHSLILENLTKKNFKTYCRFDVMPVKAMELTVKELAKFHAFSVVIKQYKPDIYRSKIQTKKYPFIFDDNGSNFITSMCKISLEYLDDDRKIKLEKYIPEMSNKFRFYISENKKTMQCLCHGDIRMNNILIKEKNGEAVTAIPIDYQSIYYGSPITDLLYLIFTSTDREYRNNYMEDLKRTYFESFTKFLKYFKIDVETVYPLKEFVSDFESQLEYGLVSAVFILPFVLAAEDDIPEINYDLKTMKMHDNFKLRLEEIVDDFIEWGYI